MMKINGECHCGQVAYEAEVDPDSVGVCHCSDCQTLSASAFRTVAIVSGELFKLTRGTPKEYVKTAESGNQRIQAFCPNCGSGLYATDAGDGPKMYNIRVGTTHQRRKLIPKFEVWCQSTVPWLPENTQTRKHQRSRN